MDSWRFIMAACSHSLLLASTTVEQPGLLYNLFGFLGRVLSCRACPWGRIQGQLLGCRVLGGAPRGSYLDELCQQCLLRGQQCKSLPDGSPSPRRRFSSAPPCDEDIRGHASRQFTESSRASFTWMVFRLASPPATLPYFLSLRIIL